MRIQTLALTFVLSISFAFPGAAAEPNPQQSGENELCLDYNLLYDNEDLNGLLTRITVDGGTRYQAWSSEGTIQLDFYNSQGRFIATNWGAKVGNVPSNASYATICISVVTGWPGIPQPAAQWTYQDGFPGPFSTDGE